MKALVLEIKDGKAAVLREDGEVVLTTQPCSVGDTIELAAEPSGEARQSVSGASKAARSAGGSRRGGRLGKRFMRTMAASLVALCIAGGSFGYLTASAESYVSVDSGDTSVELAVNHFGKVIAVNALNDESSDFADEVYKDVRGRSFDDAMEHTMAKLGRPEDGEVVFGVVSNNEKRRDAFTESIERCASEDSRLDVFTFELDKSERGKAREEQKSPGRYMFDNMHGEPGPRGGGPGRP